MFSISFISRETGISTATLRKWEQRYGFPKPNRENGYTRTYSEEELSCLSEVKRLIDRGMRPSALLKGGLEQIVPLISEHSNQAQTKQQRVFVDEALGLLISHKMKDLQILLEKKLKKIGIFNFIEQVATPLTVAVGDNWSMGVLSVFTEHCYSQQMLALLVNAVKTKQPTSDAPCVLLATLSGEKHTLGLAMVQALLFEQGAYCINLGAELPLSEFPKAVTHYQANIVGLSFSEAFPKSSIVSAIVKLRASLPVEIMLWIGGTGAKQLNKVPDGIKVLTSATDMVTAYSDYKASLKTVS
jgi:methanogenic corrinoid protein MtbC1